MKQLFSLAAAALLAWGAQAQTTFNVDMTCAPEGFENVFVTGPWCGWCANDTYNTMTDPDGDGVYTVEVADLEGVVEYKYAINGFADQENLVNDMVDGATCAPVTDYSGYANRQIDAGSVSNDYYGTCDGTCNDTPPPPGGTVLFRVDMSEYAGTYGTVNLNGSFNGWCGACATMIDDDGDMVFELPVDLPGGTVEYKFTLDGWTAQEEFTDGDPCTSTIDGYINRTLDVTGDLDLPVVCYNQCTACNAEPVPGCTDATACNYDAAATEDDGSCVFGDGPIVELTVEDALCFGGEGVLSLDSATMLLLDDGLITVEVLGAGETLPAGDYIFVATDTLGCSSETAFTIGEPDELVIDVTIVSEDSGAGDGQAEATVTGGTPEYNVVWNNMTGMEANPDSLSGGLYTAIVTDSNGCTATASLTMTVDGIVEFTALEGALFPVPVKDALNVRLATPLNSAARVDIRDVQGRLIESTQMLPNQQLLVLDAASWNAGVYTIQISNEEARASWSFVK
ncbi:MAG: T9SS type A sorting domain-containing protein [Flavobacteriales bacterium]